MALNKLRSKYPGLLFTIYILVSIYILNPYYYFSLDIVICVFMKKNITLYLQQSEMCQLQLELNQLRTESEARVTRELGPVQEQLQLHVQTVGILVGEKTELQAALTKSQNVAKQKASKYCISHWSLV
jgi:hypothetical protein